MRISDWSSDVCSSDLVAAPARDDDRRGIGAGTIAQRDREMRRVGEDDGRLGHRLARRSAQNLVRALALRLLEFGGAVGLAHLEIGRASCRERVCQYGEISVVAVYLKQKQQQI